MMSGTPTLSDRRRPSTRLVRERRLALSSANALHFQYWNWRKHTMLKKHVEEVPTTIITKEGFRGMTARFALTKDDGCPNYAMRIMEFEPEGYTSLHAHPEEHEFFFLEGEAAFIGGCGNETRLEAGDFVYVRPNEAHQIRNIGTARLRIICTIPILPGGDGKSTIAQSPVKCSKDR